MRIRVYPAIFLLILTGCSQIQTSENTSNEKVIFVKVSEAKSEKIVANLRYSGTIEPSQTIPLTFQTSGTVEKVMVEVGDAVRKGQLLASIDKTNARNMYDIANAKYTQAKDAYGRLKSVHEQGSLPEIKWVEMETNLEQAKSSLELSKSNLDKCNMYAPVNGFIGRRNIEPGMSSISIAGAPLELVDIKTVYIKIAVPENEIGLIKSGLKATCKISALNNKVVEGAITNVSPIADAISRTYNTKIRVINSDLDLKPGMVCDVTLNIPSEREMILIPYQSVTIDKEGKPYVFVVDKSQQRAKKQHIETGNFNNESLEVLSGLAKGQFIVIEGKEKLSDNCLISL